MIPLMYMHKLPHPSHLSGLSASEVADRRTIHGDNTLPEKKPPTLAELFLEQFKNPLIYVLLGVIVFTIILRDYADSVIIGIVVLLNAVIGTVQAHRTNNIVNSLKTLTKSTARVIRDGEIITIPIDEVVVGDIVYITSGDIIPADGEIIEHHTLMINESKVNGESMPVEKTTTENQAYRSTIVVSGSGILRVTSVGSNTMIGKLSTEILENVYNPTVLEQKISFLTKIILYTVLVSVSIVFALGILTGRDTVEIIKTVVSLAVSAIPEGLPMVITVVLSVGAWRISQARGLLKNLSSGATLATVSYICTDKTGTLTEGAITTREIICLDNSYTTEQINEYIAHSLDIKNISGTRTGDILDTTLAEYITIDPTWSEIKESPFTSEHKYNAKEYTTAAGTIQVYKGAPELFITDHGVFQEYTNQGYRVLCIAKKHVPENTDFSVSDTIPLALVIFEDKIRSDVPDAIRETLATGVRIMMITGDNIHTANHVARATGILVSDADISITGDQLRGYTNEELNEVIDNLRVVARANPLDKLRIVKTLQSRGEVVAMTGDGVNDGPSIALADIGIAMGITGTEVAKEAADFILVTDSFSNIRDGIFQARTIIENIKKTLVFLFSTSIGEIFIIGTTVAMGLPIALLPAQILWLNLITDGFLNIALAYEPSEKVYGQYNYKRYHGFILTTYDIVRMFIMAITMSVVSLVGFISVLGVTSTVMARTVALMTMTIIQWFNALNVRRHYDSIFSYNPFSNNVLTGVFILQVFVLYITVKSPFGATFLQTVPLSIQYIFWIILGSLGIIVSDELYKQCYRYYTLHKTQKV